MLVTDLEGSEISIVIVSGGRSGIIPEPEIALDLSTIGSARHNSADAERIAQLTSRAVRIIFIRTNVMRNFPLWDPLKITLNN